jgi:hypothetical protein
MEVGLGPTDADETCEFKVGLVGRLGEVDLLREGPKEWRRCLNFFVKPYFNCFWLGMCDESERNQPHLT